MRKINLKFKIYKGYVVYSDGRIFSLRRGFFCKQSLAGAGYKNVWLNVPGKKKHLVHRLVAECFLSRPAGCNEVHHINHDKLDNRIENLQWTTRLHNMQEAWRAGRFTHQIGHKNRATGFSKKEIELMRDMFGSGIPNKWIAWAYDTRPSNISRIKCGYVQHLAELDK